MGFVGRNGVFHANEAARTCDVLLALGVRFDDRSSSSWIPGYSFNIPPTRLIHVDIDAEEIGRNYPVHLGIVGDVRTVLRQLLAATEAPGTEAAAHEAWLADIAKWRAQWEEFVRPHETSEAEPMHPQRVVQALQAVHAGRRDHPSGRRRAPQLDGPVLAGAAAADAAQQLGLRGHGVRRLRRARRQAGRARPALRDACAATAAS